MNSERKYGKPPVIEALCEVFFQGSEWDDTIPGRFYEEVKVHFPGKRQRENQAAQLSLSAGGEASAGVKRLPPWMQFLTEDESCMIQLGRDLLVVNRFQPYPHFEDWESVIYDAIDRYRRLAQPTGIARVGVRYINRILIPQAKFLMEDYFTVYPKLPRKLGNEHRAFLIRVEVPAENGQHSVKITFGTAPSPGPDATAFLLDLYDICETSLKFDQVEEAVKAAHKHLEDAFEGSLTDKLRGVFGQEGLKK